MSPAKGTGGDQVVEGGHGMELGYMDLPTWARLGWDDVHDHRQPIAIADSN